MKAAVSGAIEMSVGLVLDPFKNYFMFQKYMNHLKNSLGKTSSQVQTKEKFHKRHSLFKKDIDNKRSAIFQSESSLYE